MLFTTPFHPIPEINFSCIKLRDLNPNKTANTDTSPVLNPSPNMGFFDLNIPYVESPPSNATTHKNARVKIVIKAMELGYTGVAYNRTMKDVMSDRDRCSIPLLTLASLLKLAPSLSASVNFHRDLLGVPRCSPFRQYTRLTVFADTIAQCQVLNSGNPVLKTYDLVAVRPLNQSAFDHACEKAEVCKIYFSFFFFFFPLIL